MGKLIKYELRSLWKIFLPCWGALILLGILNSSSLGAMQQESGIPFMWLFGTFVNIIGIFAIAIITLVFMITRFYKGLLRDSGYLMFTLPVSANALIWSKAISAAILTLGTGACCIFSYASMFKSLFGYTLSNFSDLKISFSATDGTLNLLYILILVTLVLLAVSTVFQGIFQCYFSMSVGHLANKNRVLIAVLTYFGINIAFSAVTSFFNSTVFNSQSSAMVIMNRLLSFSLTNTNDVLGAWVTLLISLLISVLLTGLYAFFTRLILSKRLNLE